jgi:hypothetical protein
MLQSAPLSQSAQLVEQSQPPQFVLAEQTKKPDSHLVAAAAARHMQHLNSHLFNLPLSSQLSNTLVANITAFVANHSLTSPSSLAKLVSSPLSSASSSPDSTDQPTTPAPDVETDVGNGLHVDLGTFSQLASSPAAMSTAAAALLNPNGSINSKNLQSALLSAQALLLANPALFAHPQVAAASTYLFPQKLQLAGKTIPQSGTIPSAGEGPGVSPLA